MLLVDTAKYHNYKITMGKQIEKLKSELQSANQKVKELKAENAKVNELLAKTIKSLEIATKSLKESEKNIDELKTRKDEVLSSWLPAGRKGISCPAEIYVRVKENPYGNGKNR